MKQTYSQEQLIQFIYGEVSICDHFEIMYAIENDAALKEVHEELYSSYKSLPKASFFPSKTSIDNILQASRENLLEASI